MAGVARATADASGLRPTDDSYDHYRNFVPAKHGDRAERHWFEPHVGATRYILGVRPELAGLRIDPCLPEGWVGFAVTRRFRGLDLTINVVNIDGIEVASTDDEGKRGALVPVEVLTEGAVLTVTMG
jgi:cellobiose phosphorylase